MRLSVIGGGFMGEASIDQAIARGVVAAEAIQVCELHTHRRDYLTNKYKVAAHADAAVAVDGSDVLVLAVKPQEFDALAETLHRHLPSRQLIVSIMAGVRMQHIGDALSQHHVARVMPNLAVSVGEAFSLWTAADEVDEAQRGMVRSLVGSWGRELFTEEEKLLDMATAVVGSGPGYIMLLLESLIDGAVHIGLRRDVATEMVMQTMLGAVRWAQASGGHPADLRGRVASPGGTTVEGILALERGGVRAAIIEAVIAGYEKSRALGG